MATHRVSAGVCRRCGCTDKRACQIERPGLFGEEVPTACWWVDREHTRCSACFVRVGRLAFAHQRQRYNRIARIDLDEVKHAHRR
jgi:hypothetical protein